MVQTFTNAEPVTTHDTTDFPNGIANALHVGGAGTVTVVLPGGETVQFTAAAGTYLYIRCKRVNATGTAATNIVALY